MKFLVDAQLPARLARQLNEAGHDATHTLDLPEKNRTGDEEVYRVADSEGRVVVSKDHDFRDGHLLRGTPQRLLIVATGNVTNRDLLVLFEQHLEAIVAAFEGANLIELGPDHLTILDQR